MKEFFFGKSVSFVECWLLIIMMHLSYRHHETASIVVMVLYIVLSLTVTVEVEVVEDNVVDSAEESHRVA